jgi:serine/threonine protein kinase
MPRIARYRLDAVHGIGAFATVWRAWDPQLEVDVAVKVLAENWANHADVRERFLAEARLLRRIEDPRVVRVHDVGTYDGRPYFVMDFVDGGTLDERIADGPSTEEALRLAVEACRGVQVLHDAGVLHRDVKPTNVLVRDPDDGGPHRVLVSDLGSAKKIAEASGVTVTTGTPAYMSPEQARGRPIDPRTDVYSLGVLAYQLLTGEPPFVTGDVTSLLSRTPTDRPAPVARATGLPTGIDHVLGRALAFDPHDRPDTARQLADAFEQLQQGSRRVHGLGRLRHDVPVGVVAAAGVAAFAGAAGVITFWP